MKTKLSAPVSVFLVITVAVVISGTIARAGDIVEVTEGEAKDLLGRGKARLATAEDGVDVPAVSAAGQDDEEQDEAGAAAPAAASADAKPAAAAKSTGKGKGK